ncbi:hypothetical protein CEXT_786831 [Caerostris extrusa]|uniref:Uncharacterized protein n=1 Tax=Caerostris extrusa TaxID=172846 RepID=A0AAV4M9J1_CAEEX|nr:hypothetical protein CEXT_786831 [Caerostris extrusa]
MTTLCHIFGDFEPVDEWTAFCLDHKSQNCQTAISSMEKQRGGCCMEEIKTNNGECALSNMSVDQHVSHVSSPDPHLRLPRNNYMEPNIPNKYKDIVMDTIQKIHRKLLTCKSLSLLSRTTPRAIQDDASHHGGLPKNPTLTNNPDSVLSVTLNIS